jgi:GH35 family endo-1,4-beta-xylanase
MENQKWSRRQVIGSLATFPLAVNVTLASLSNKVQVKTKPVKCTILNSSGEPLETSEMDRFYICDLMSRPFQINPQFDVGEIVFIPATAPFRIGLPLEVPGFGKVFLYADNRGNGYTADFLKEIEQLFLNYEFAADRLATIKKMIIECQRSGIKLSSEVMNRVSSSEKYFARCNDEADDKAVVKWAMESLRESLYAGEMIVVEKAQKIIEKRGARPGFLFGCNAFRFNDYGNPYTRLFEPLFNYATLPFYMGSVEKAQGQPDYSRVDRILEALQNTQIIPKGHPLIFLTPNETPDWAKYKPFEEIKQICTNYIHRSILQYRGRIHIWDVINEAHVQPDIQYGDATIPGYTKEQTLELSQAAAKTARKADPTCYRIINCTGTWADYYMGRHPAPWQQNAYDYLQMLQDEQCDYEAIGLQYYHSGRDLLEFERDLERFAKFNKPIHITELQIPSSSDDIPGKDWWGGGAGGAGFLWHGEKFTETIQADWVESIYTILYSKPYIDAITWWDFKDPAFVPHGGLIHADMSPKESYYRLKALLDQWKKHS